MKRRPIETVVLILVLISFGGCMEIAHSDGRGIPASPRSEPENLTIASMPYLYPASRNATYLMSDQFLLCRRKTICPIDSHLTPLPPPRPSQAQTVRKESIAKKTDAMIHATVHFASGSTELDPEAQTVLNQLLTQLNGVQFRDLRAIIAGYTDGSGSEELNNKIAIERAEAVAGYFHEREITFKNMEVGSQPLCCYISLNNTVDGRAKNRRTEIWLQPTLEEKDESTK